MDRVNEQAKTLFSSAAVAQRAITLNLTIPDKQSRSPRMDLTAAQRQQLHAARLAAFPTRAALVPLVVAAFDPVALASDRGVRRLAWVATPDPRPRAWRPRRPPDPQRRAAGPASCSKADRAAR